MLCLLLSRIPRLRKQRAKTSLIHHWKTTTLLPVLALKPKYFLSLNVHLYHNHWKICFIFSQTTEPAVLPTNSLHGQIGSHPSTTFPQPTLIHANTSTPSSSNLQSTAQSLTHTELQRRQEELERKAAELAAKEEALRNLEGSVSKPHNWPPLPSFCPIGPCFYQDISMDIRPEFQKIVTYAYYLWMLYFLVLLMNMLTAIVLEVNKVVDSGMFASIIYVFAFTPLSFVGWFRPLYKAFRSDSSFNFMIFFFVFFCHLAVSVLFAIGTPSGSWYGLEMIS